MKVLIAGSSGFLGTAISSALVTTGFQVFKLKRQKIEAPNDILWDPEKGVIPTVEIEGFNVIINLAGENILGRWTPTKKKRLLQSRVLSTTLLAETIAELNFPPEFFINASATGYYGNRGDELLTETSPAGEGFLADLCKQWETAASLVEKQGIRCAILRLGLVLSTKGGALSKMLLPFKLGLGGKIGSGNQYISWITLDDFIGAVMHLIQNKECHGVYNLTSPEPVTNSEFTQALGQTLHRPTFLNLPAFMVKLLFGELGEAAFLTSARVQPQRLLESEYHFQYPHLMDALEHLINKQL